MVCEGHVGSQCFAIVDTSAFQMGIVQKESLSSLLDMINHENVYLITLISSMTAGYRQCCVTTMY